MQNETAPERIWAGDFYGSKAATGHCVTVSYSGYTEYVRADLCRGPEPVAVTEAMVEAAKDYLEIDWDGDEPYIRSDSIDSALEAALASAQPAAEWRDIATAPNNEKIIVLWDDGETRILPSDDNDYDWTPYPGKSDFCTRPLGWLPMSFLPTPPAQGEAP